MRPLLVWNVEFKALNDFLCIDAHYLECFGSIFLTSPSYPNIVKQIYLDPQLLFTLGQGFI